MTAIRVALDEPAGAIHCAIEIGFASICRRRSPASSWPIQTHVRSASMLHLFAGHAIESEAGGDLSHPLRPAGDDYVLHDDENQKHDQADGVITADDVLPTAEMTRPALASDRMRRVPRY